MHGNGPIQGTAKYAGVLVAGSDPVAVDATCCRIMRINPYLIPYLRLATGGVDAQISERNIQQSGEAIGAVATPFDLISEFRSFRLENG
jgi:uncharacterized protein (DUF362 family)